MSARDGFRLDKGHRQHCMFGDRAQEAFMLLDDVPVAYSRKRNGHKGGGSAFYRLRCNDPQCPAIALVRCDTVASFVAAGLGSGHSE